MTSSSSTPVPGTSASSTSVPTVEHVLAVVPVTDLTVSAEWYERLFGGPPTNVPMPGILAEWQVTGTGWVQVTVDADRAGHTLLNIASTDLDARRDNLDRLGLAPEAIVEANKGVRLCSVVDPDGNRVTFIGGFRPVY